MLFVPVVDKNHIPLMPTKPQRAKRWIQSGKATPFWKRGIFCVRLNVEPSDRQTQAIAVGIDTGIKKEALTVKSEAHTFLHLHVDAVTWVQEAIETRRTMRRGRRNRKTPYRCTRLHRSRGRTTPSPSIKARWQWKLRLVRWLQKMFPISVLLVEDIKARTKKGKTKKARRWNRSFSPLMVGKQWFKRELAKLGIVILRFGWETALYRKDLGLYKSSLKLSDLFEAHCVDSWTLANTYFGGTRKPENTTMLLITPLRVHRRQLHRLQPSKGGERLRYGGTRSLGFTRGSLVKHQKYGVVYVGGYQKDGISLHDLKTGKRLCRTAKPKDCRFLTFNSWRSRVYIAPPIPEMF